MTTPAIVIAFIVVGALVLAGLWELFAFWAIGPIKERDYNTWRWLQDDDVRLNLSDNGTLYKPLKFGGHTNRKISYIKKHKPTLFSTYFVETPDGKCFRVLKGSLLHGRIKQKHMELLNEKDKPFYYEI